MFYRKSYFSLYYWLEWEVLAKQLASLGAKLIISARNEAELESQEIVFWYVLPLRTLIPIALISLYNPFS